MLRTLKYLNFVLISLFLIEVSNADPRLYYVQKTPNHNNDWIRACYISATTGDLDTARCQTVYSDAYIRPNAVVISSDNKIGYISSETGGYSRYGTVLTCDVTKRYANLKNCRDIAYNFYNPQGMVMDSSGRLYITESGSGIITVCNSPQNYAYCTPASQKLLGSPNSIALNPNGNYAYITLPDTNNFYVCKINKADLSGRFESCIYYSGGFFDAPGAVTVDPTGKFLYFVNRRKVSGAEYNAFNCRLTDSGDNIIECFGSQVGIFPYFAHTTSITVFPLQLFTDASVGYVTDLHYIYRCLISNVGFTYSCVDQPTDIPLESFLSYLFLYPY